MPVLFTWILIQQCRQAGQSLQSAILLLHRQGHLLHLKAQNRQGLAVISGQQMPSWSVCACHPVDGQRRISVSTPRPEASGTSGPALFLAPMGDGGWPNTDVKGNWHICHLHTCNQIQLYAFGIAVQNSFLGKGPMKVRWHHVMQLKLSA